MIENVIIGVILAAIVGAAVVYIIKAKRNGAKCIGCPAGSECSHNCGGTSECGCGDSCR